MIAALIKAQCISLFRDRMAMLLSFALPCIMFTVFAVIFGGGGVGTNISKLKVVVLDQDNSRSSQKLIDSLTTMDQLDVSTMQDETTQDSSESSSGVSRSGKINVVSEQDSRKQAAKLIRGGKAAAAVIMPKGLEASMAEFGASDRPAIELIYDPANPLAEQMLAGVLQASAFTSSPGVLMEKGLEQFRQLGGPFSPLQDAAVVTFRNLLDSSAESTRASDSTEVSPFDGMISMTDGIVRIASRSARDVLPAAESGSGKVTSANMISYYAAGISVMFVMFSMSGAATGLLEHEERGTLERLLSGRMSIIHLLLSHWIFYVGFGVIQISSMFVFAWAVFGLDLWHAETLAGAGLMAIASAMASGAFVMMIATLCKSRKQLEGLSTIIILLMSAIGGSMMPRFIMPEFVLKFSSVAFNAWAMDGFLKVFWYNTPDQSIVRSIMWEVCVILSMAAAFLCVAFVAARKWAVR